MGHVLLICRVGRQRSGLRNVNEVLQWGLHVHTPTGLAISLAQMLGGPLLPREKLVG